MGGAAHQVMSRANYYVQYVNCNKSDLDLYCTLDSYTKFSLSTYPMKTITKKIVEWVGRRMKKIY
jgi:hypothetical protein